MKKIVLNGLLLLSFSTYAESEILNYEIPEVCKPVLETMLSTDNFSSVATYKESPDLSFDRNDTKFEIINGELTAVSQGINEEGAKFAAQMGEQMHTDQLIYRLYKPNNNDNCKVAFWNRTDTSYVNIYTEDGKIVLDGFETLTYTPKN